MDMRRRLHMQMKKDSPLPSEYQRIEYLKNPDMAYIVTDWTSGEVLRIDIDFYLDSMRSWCNLAGASDRTSDIYGSAIQLSHSNKMKLAAYGRQPIVTDRLSAGSRYNMSAVFESGNQSLKVNGTVLGTASYAWNTSVPYMSIFGAYYGNLTAKALERSLVSVYSCKFYGSDDLLLDEFIPCYRKADGEPGMYGTLSKRFYTNAGTGSFEKGQDI